MKKEIEKLELHIVRLEQAIRQVQRLKRMGLADEKANQKIDEYLEAVLNFSKKFFFGPFRSCSSSDSPLSSSSQKRKCLKNSSQIIAQ